MPIDKKTIDSSIKAETIDTTVPEDIKVLCVLCNSPIKEDYLKKQYYQEEYPQIRIGPLCSSCFSETRICSACQQPHIADETIKYYKKGYWFCKSCAKKEMVQRQILFNKRVIDTLRPIVNDTLEEKHKEDYKSLLKKCNSLAGIGAAI